MVFTLSFSVLEIFNDIFNLFAYLISKTK